MTSIKRYTNALLAAMRRVNSRRHKAIFIDDSNGRFVFEHDDIVSDLTVVDNEEDLGYAKATLQSNRFIFDTWRKISRGVPVTPRQLPDGSMTPTKEEVGFSDAAIPSEAAGFYYDADLDMIGNTIDTFSMVGFVSNDYFTDFDFDVQITSISEWQNDPVGLIIGYVQDADGTSHTLEVFRRLTTQPVFSISMDYGTIGEITTIAGTNDGLDYATGEPATGSMTVPPDKNPWSVNPWVNAPEGIRIRVERRGDIYTVIGSKYNSQTLVQESKLTLDLNSRPELARFKQPVQYGFMSQSQDLVNWKALQRPTDSDVIYDLRDRTEHRYVNSQWETTPIDISTVIKRGRFYFNPVSRKLFHCDVLGTIRQVKNET